jgi:hypothetical protein
MTKELIDHLLEYTQEKRERLYRVFYSSYLAAEDNHDERLILRYRNMCAVIRELFEFSTTDVLYLEAQEANALANAKEFLELEVGPAEEVPARLN